MKKNKDYTLLALAIPFAIAVLFNLPACYSSKDVKRDNLERHFKSDVSSIQAVYVCPDCGETGCIYEDIDERYDQGTDIEIEQAIQAVCKERGIKDAKTIDLIKANYYL